MSCPWCSPPLTWMQLGPGYGIRPRDKAVNDGWIQLKAWCEKYFTVEFSFSGCQFQLMAKPSVRVWHPSYGYTEYFIWNWKVVQVASGKAWRAKIRSPGPIFSLLLCFAKIVLMSENVLKRFGYGYVRGLKTKVYLSRIPRQHLLLPCRTPRLVWRLHKSLLNRQIIKTEAAFTIEANYWREEADLYWNPPGACTGLTMPCKHL